MCILAWSWDAKTKELLLIANRDEFYARPTQAMHWWDGGEILAGKDLQTGGTWMGLSKPQHDQHNAQVNKDRSDLAHSNMGRLAALTNFRDPAHFRTDAKSRGNLVLDFLASEQSAPEYIASIAPQKDLYNGYNPLLFDGNQLVGYESHSGKILSFNSGVHAVSNAGFDSTWPKIKEIKNALQNCIAHKRCDDDYLFALLHDSQTAPDEALPNTGVGMDLERMLSSIFIQSAAYGTRSSSIVRLQIGAEGAAHWIVTERSFDKGEYAAEVREEWSL